MSELRSLVLSKRKAAEWQDMLGLCASLDLPEEGKKVTPEQLKNQVMAFAQVVNDSLKATYINLRKSRNPLNWIKALKYKRFYNGDIKYLLQTSENSELAEMYNSVIDLENGGKKKVQASQAVSQSVEMSQEGK